MSKQSVPRHRINGWIALDKPYGMGSTEAVTSVTRMLHPEKIGHGGTLDPLASGILPIALGEATKTVAYMMDAQKIYEFTLHFGEETSTLDVEGEVVARSDIRPTPEAILSVLPQFLGEQDQVPPAFSALKVDGKRAYDLARAGQEVMLQPRRIRIDALEMLRVQDDDACMLRVVCGKGTYVRSLARDIAYALGTVGHVSYLHRSAVGVLHQGVKISLEMLEKLVHSHQPADSDAVVKMLHSVLLPLDGVLDDIPAIELASEEARRLTFGQKVEVTPLQCVFPVYRVHSDGKLIAMVACEDGVLRVLRGFNL
jgi:tRNA pseudouridine55 synthase